MRFALLHIDMKSLAVHRYIRHPDGRAYRTDEAQLEEVGETSLEELERFRLAPPRKQVTGVFA